MKNQYIGDVGDYGKYGLLRFLRDTGMQIGVNWYLTPCDERTDGCRREYLDAVCRLVRLWHDRLGECIEERNGFKRLCFHDTPGGKPDEAWLPVYLLTETEAPEYMCEHISADEIEEEINDAFGFD